MDEKLYKALIDGIKESVLRVRKKPPTDYYSNTHIISERNLEIDFDNLLGGPPDFIRIETDKNCTLDYKVKKGKESFYRNYPEGIDADDPIRIISEGWRAIRITPSAYPCTVKIYASIVGE